MVIIDLHGDRCQKVVSTGPISPAKADAYMADDRLENWSSIHPSHRHLCIRAPKAGGTNFIRGKLQQTVFALSQPGRFLPYREPGNVCVIVLEVSMRP